MFWDKNKFITLALLLILSILAFFSVQSTTHSKSIDVETDFFAVLDSNSVKEVQIKNVNSQVQVSSKSGLWMVNGRYQASLLNISRLLYIIKNVRIKRELSGVTSQQTIDKLIKEGTQIKIFGTNGVMQEYIVDNGDITTSSCFYSPANKKAYFVELPAYTDDFSQFLNADVNHWRSRLICTNSLKSLDEVTSNWSGKKVSLKFKNDFFVVDGVKNIDSNTVGMYLIQYRNLECDRFVEDSLKSLCKSSNLKSFASVTIKDIDSTENNVLTFFEYSANKKQFLGYSSKLDECFWLNKAKTMDLLIESEQLFAKRKED